MILQRLKEYIDKKGISIAAFEKSIGMSNASFGKSLKSGGTIGVDKLEKILIIYPDINIEWLLKGRGEMTGPVDESSEKIYKKLFEEKEEEVKKLNREIGRLEAKVDILRTPYNIIEKPPLKVAEDRSKFIKKITGGTK
jgi:transcriptional regulator with XRE-family HTH domain